MIMQWAVMVKLLNWALLKAKSYYSLNYVPQEVGTNLHVVEGNEDYTTVSP